MKTGPFEDGQARCTQQMPGAQHIPTLSFIAEKAIPGVFVKLGCKGDYFWVQVNNNDPGTQIITGIVVTTPARSNAHHIRMRDPVQCSYRHVLDILPL